jgi:hypothetical protein
MRDLVICFCVGVAVAGFLADWPVPVVCVAATAAVMVPQLFPRKRGG